MRCRANASQRIQRVYEEMTGAERGCGVTRGDFLNDSNKEKSENSCFQIAFSDPRNSVYSRPDSTLHIEILNFRLMSL